MREQYHITPNEDLREHMYSGQWCHCLPEIRYKGEVILVMHNSYDGREFTEENNETISGGLSFGVSLVRATIC